MWRNLSEEFKKYKKREKNLLYAILRDDLIEIKKQTGIKKILEDNYKGPEEEIIVRMYTYEDTIITTIQTKDLEEFVFDRDGMLHKETELDIIDVMDKNKLSDIYNNFRVLIRNDTNYKLKEIEIL